MAITIDSSSEDKIDLPEFVDFINSEIDVNDQDSLISASSMLKKLGNNKEVFINAVNSDLKEIVSGQQGNPYSSQAVLLAKLDRYMVRTNFWLPFSSNATHQAHDEVFIYEKAHCHNFDLLTVGYHGSGYHTRIWEYDSATIEGKIGEKVELKFLEDTSLSEGKIMFYRGSKDVHTQSPPKEFSMSLNLMNFPKLGREQKNQFFFDTENSQITGFANYNNREFLMKLAGYLGDENTMDILNEVKEDHYCARTKKAASSSFDNLNQHYGSQG